MVNWTMKHGAKGKVTGDKRANKRAKRGAF